ncbi:MAG: sugar transferase [Fimbriimonadaceae bacterium]|nr:sugar transferase [Fimbriimonadaceae bacterium]
MSERVGTQEQLRWDHTATIDVKEIADRRNAKTRERRLLVALLVAADAVATLSAFFFVLWPALLESTSSATSHPLTDTFSACGVVGGLLLVRLTLGLYLPANVLSGSNEYERSFLASSLGTLALVFAGGLVPTFALSGNQPLLFWAWLTFASMIGRFVVRRVVYLLRKRGVFVERVLIVGANREGIAIGTQLAQAKAAGARIVGFLDEVASSPSEPMPGAPLLGRAHDLRHVVETQRIDSVVIADPAQFKECLAADRDTMRILNDTELQMTPGFFEVFTTGIRIREDGFVPLIALNKARISGIHRIFKSTLDRLCSALLLLILLPLFLLLMLLIKLGSKGPAMYRRRVVGLGRQEFDAFKFRTMVMNGNDILTEEQKLELKDYGKLKDDPRITKIGMFIRKYSLDELPQLLNVLRGEMSLVGPRMLTYPELEKFGEWEHSLLTVKPGMTGLWQVSGRSDLTYDDRVKLDMYYIRNYTIWLDIDILIRTIPAMISGRGAY